MKRINDAAATMLEHARLYLAGLPMDQQYFTFDQRTGQLVNEAIPVLFAAEYHVRNEFSQI